MLRQVCTVIDRHRQRGQTTRLVSLCDGGGTLLITANKEAEKHIEPLAVKVSPLGRPNVKVTSLHSLDRERGRDHKNGVVFDNHAVHTIASMADQEILTLQDRVAFLERKNAEAVYALGVAKDKSDQLTAVIATQARLLNDALPSPEPRDTGGNPPWGESYEAVQDLSEAVRRAVDALNDPLELNCFVPSGSEGGE